MSFQKRLESKLRKFSGQGMALAIAVALILIIAGVAYLGFVFLFGGSRELQNAADAGALGVAVQALIEPEYELQPNTDEDLWFGGVAEERNGKHYINLRNINRVWGQIFLILANVNEMDGLNVADQRAYDNARRVYLLATKVGRGLTAKIADAQDTFKATFQDLVQKNPTAMIKGGRTVQSLGTSFVDENKPSNVYVDPKCLSPGTLLTAPIDQNTGDLRGYRRFNANLGPYGNEEFYFVPTEYKTKPHLISQQKFNELKKLDNSFGYQKGAVPPNAFSFSMTTQDEQKDTALTVASAAVAKDVRDRSQISFPHGYIRVDNRGGVPNDWFTRLLGWLGWIVPPAPQHVLDVASKSVTGAFNKALNPSTNHWNVNSIGELLASTMFNPIQVKCDRLNVTDNNMGVQFPPLNSITDVPSFLNWLNSSAKSIWCSMAVRRAVGCVSKFMAIFCPMYPQLCGHAATFGLLFCTPNIFDDVKAPCLHKDSPDSCSYHFVHGHSPAVSKGVDSAYIHGPGAVRNGDGSGWYTVYPTEANKHALLFDLERDDQALLQNMTFIGEFLNTPSLEINIDWGKIAQLKILEAISITLNIIQYVNNIIVGDVPGSLDLQVFLAYYFAFEFENNRSYPNSYRDVLTYTVPDGINADPTNFVSGMKKRDTSGQLPSLLNRYSKRQYSTDGSLKDFIFSRKSNSEEDPQGKIQQVYDYLKRRCLQILPNDETQVDNVLNNDLPLPMGRSAIIWCQNCDIPDSSQKSLQVSILKSDNLGFEGGTQPPQWLIDELSNSPRVPEEPYRPYNPSDSIDHPISFKIEGTPKTNHYRLVDPVTDFDHPADKNLPDSQDYPTRLQIVDEYNLQLSSGHNGLLTELELKSRLKSKCYSSGNDWGQWTYPEDCFKRDSNRFPEYSGSIGEFYQHMDYKQFKGNFHGTIINYLSRWWDLLTWMGQHYPH